MQLLKTTIINTYKNLQKASVFMIVILLFITGSQHAFGVEKETDKKTWHINVRNADIREFIVQIATITGFTFVIDPRIKGNVTAISSIEMDKEMVYELFLSVLTVHGYAAVPAGEIIKIVRQSTAKQHNQDVKVGNDSDKGQKLITRVIKINYVKSDELFRILRPLIPSYSHIASIQSSNSLIISDHADNISRLEKIIAQTDVQDEYTIEIVHPKNTLAVTIFNQMEQLFPENKASKSGSLNANKINLIVDEQDNSLIMRGKASLLKKFQVWIDKLDKKSNSEQGNTSVIRLDHADAEDLTTIISNLISPRQNQLKNSKDKNFSIQADPTLNALVIRASQETMLDITNLIKELDVRRSQVLIEAAIVEVSLNDDLSLGVEFSVGNASNNIVPLITTSTTGFLGSFLGSLIGTGNTSSASQLAAAAGSLTQPTAVVAKIGIDGLSFGAILQALDVNTNSNLLSTPSIVTLDNETAEIIVGQNVPFRTGTFTTSTDGANNPFMTISREDVGVSLKVTPQISKNSTIRLIIEQEVSSIAPIQTIGANSVSDIITNKRFLQTSVLIDNRQTIVLGGLIQEDRIKTVRKVPLLGSIPLLGYLFRSTTDRKVKRNLLVFIHPTILHDSSEATTVTRKKYNTIRELLVDSKFLDGRFSSTKEAAAQDSTLPIFK